jgi:hypothetical protein
MLATAAAVVFVLALIFDLADISTDAFNHETLVSLGLLLLALHLAGWGTTGWRWSSGRRRR